MLDKSKTIIDSHQVRQRLPFGAIKVIKERTKASNSTIHRVINGDSDNSLVLEAIANYLLEQNKRHRKVSSKIQKALNETA